MFREEEDEETMEWEQEQLRRGGHQTPEPSAPAKVKEVYRPAPSNFYFVLHRPASHEVPVPLATPLPMLNTALARLTQQLTQLTTSHAQNTAALNSLAQERDEIDAREKEMREMVGRAEEKSSWFGSFKEWVEGVAGFLDEKVISRIRLICWKSTHHRLLTVSVARKARRRAFVFASGAI